MAGRKKTLARRLATLVFLIALIPFVGVTIHAVLPVPITSLMVIRAFEGEGLDYRWRGFDDISPNLVRAAIAAEDARFCAHSGFDMEAIQQALAANEAGGNLRGGSTISQQTAKNVFLWPGRSWLRKGLEAGYTVLIEAVWSKKRIVHVYLNVAEFGPGVYGAEAGARYWFGKSARDLTPREAARMAAILPSPRRYNAGSPGPYVRRRASRIQAAMGTIRNEGLDACVFDGSAPAAASERDGEPARSARRQQQPDQPRDRGLVDRAGVAPGPADQDDRDGEVQPYQQADPSGPQPWQQQQPAGELNPDRNRGGDVGPGTVQPAQEGGELGHPLG